MTDIAIAFGHVQKCIYYFMSIEHKTINGINRKSESLMQGSYSWRKGSCIDFDSGLSIGWLSKNEFASIIFTLVTLITKKNKSYFY